MKKFKFLLTIMVATFMSLASANAEEESTNILYGCNIENKICNYAYLKSIPYGMTIRSEWNEYEEAYAYNPEVFDNLYNDVMEAYEVWKEDYPYYIISIYMELNPNHDLPYDELSSYFASNVYSTITMSLFFLDSPFSLDFEKSYELSSSDTLPIIDKVYFKTYERQGIISYIYSDNTYRETSNTLNPATLAPPLATYQATPTAYGYYDYNLFLPLRYYDSNFDIINNTGYTLTVPDYNNLIINPGDVIQPIRKSSNLNSNIIEVNLDNYEYVVLNLKDYTKKDAFSSNLQVKGMIGITPVYEFGTVEKEIITDRCNISYTDYTDYRLYVLENDLINNSVYYIKACEEGSSFKFDSTVFDITYVNESNKDNPVITINGTNYNTIPFNNLSNSANKNEEENFIPGESGSSITDVIDNITDYISSFWNSLTTFMSLVTKFFNTLPIEIRAVCITSFTVACTLGLLKILKS